MEYLIDGYNLLFSFFSEVYDIDQQRVFMIKELYERAKRVKGAFTFVFDGSYTDHLHLSREYYHSFFLHFTPKNVSADHYIKDELVWKKKGSLLTVVSSDQNLVRSCTERGALTQSCFEFLSWLEHKGSKIEEAKPNQDIEIHRKRLEKIFLDRLKREDLDDEED